MTTTICLPLEHNLQAALNSCVYSSVHTFSFLLYFLYTLTKKDTPESPLSRNWKTTIAKATGANKARRVFCQAPRAVDSTKRSRVAVRKEVERSEPGVVKRNKNEVGAIVVTTNNLSCRATTIVHQPFCTKNLAPVGSREALKRLDTHNLRETSSYPGARFRSPSERESSRHGEQPANGIRGRGGCSSKVGRCQR